MTVFYVLPARPLLADRLAALLQEWLPGLDWDCASRSELIDGLTTAAEQRGVCVVYREDLPPGEATARALADGFGAEPGDEVVEVRCSGRGEELTARRWRIGAAPLPLPVYGDPTADPLRN
jgi:hypothetical protein